MYGVRGTDLNSLERRSFSSFLSLYIGSSVFFIFLSSYWYYSAQKSSLESMTYYKLQNIASNVSSLIIKAHMMNTKLILPRVEDGYEYMLVPAKENKVYDDYYFEEDGRMVLISDAPHKHLAVEYVVAKTTKYHEDIYKLQRNVLVVMMGVFIVMVIISWFLSKLFMRPIQEKVVQIEQFIGDVTHELNTPITALKMSTKRALQKQQYDEKILRNISISTKQLFSIYKSLTFLNFSAQKQESENSNLKLILEQSIEYYSELLIAKNIYIKANLADSYLNCVPSRMELLFSNMLSNAIKYSLPNTNITLVLEEDRFSIQDEGFGIEQEKVRDIFTPYERGSNIAGGFGVGLSIVKQICDEYNISIEVLSELEKGATFIFTWDNR